MWLSLNFQHKLLTLPVEEIIQNIRDMKTKPSLNGNNDFDIKNVDVEVKIGN